MKRILWLFAILNLTLNSQAQTNEPVALAVIAESPEAAMAADILTAQFSGEAKVRLVERTEIEKIYREQGLSAANTTPLKLGKILSADGLLLLNEVKAQNRLQFNLEIPADQARNINARLIAVRPDESPFWSGSYLLEGVVDQKGYDKDIVTLNAQLKKPFNLQKFTALFQAGSYSKAQALEIQGLMGVWVLPLSRLHAAFAAQNPGDSANHPMPK